MDGNKPYRLIKHFSRLCYLSDEDIGEFEEKVNLAMKEGWEPIGGISSSSTIGDKVCLMQALINK